MESVDNNNDINGSENVKLMDSSGNTAINVVTVKDSRSGNNSVMYCDSCNTTIGVKSLHSLRTLRLCLACYGVFAVGSVDKQSRAKQKPTSDVKVVASATTTPNNKKRKTTHQSSRPRSDEPLTDCKEEDNDAPSSIGTITDPVTSVQLDTSLNDCDDMTESAVLLKEITVTTATIDSCEQQSQSSSASSPKKKKAALTLSDGTPAITCASCDVIQPVNTRFVHVAGGIKVCRNCEPLFRSRSTAATAVSTTKEAASTNVATVKKSKHTVVLTDSQQSTNNPQVLHKKTKEQPTNKTPKSKCKTISASSTECRNTASPLKGRKGNNNHKSNSVSLAVNTEQDNEPAASVDKKLEECTSCLRTFTVPLVIVGNGVQVCSACESVFRASGSLHRRASVKVAMNLETPKPKATPTKRKITKSKAMPIKAETTSIDTNTEDAVSSSTTAMDTDNASVDVESASAATITSESKEETSEAVSTSPPTTKTSSNAKDHRVCDSCSSSVLLTTMQRAGQLQICSQCAPLFRSRATAISSTPARNSTNNVSVVSKTPKTPKVNSSTGSLATKSTTSKQRRSSSTATNGLAIKSPKSRSRSLATPKQQQQQPLSTPLAINENEVAITPSSQQPQQVPCESCGCVTVHGLRQIGQLMVCPACALVFNCRGRVIRTAPVMNEAVHKQVASSEKKTKPSVKAITSDATDVNELQSSSSSTTNLTETEEMTVVEDTTSTKPIIPDVLCECCGGSVKGYALTRIGRLNVCINCVPLFRSRAAAQTKLLANRIKQYEADVSARTHRKRTRRTSSKKKRAKTDTANATRDNLSFCGDDAHGDEAEADEDNEEEYKESSSDGDDNSVQDLANNASAPTKRVRCESCHIEAPDTTDPDLQFRILGSLLLCPGCEPLFATGLRGKRRILLPPWALDQASFEKLNLDDLEKHLRLETMNFANSHITSTPRPSKGSRSTRKKGDGQALAKKDGANDEANEIEYFREEMANEDGESWLLYCDQCRMVIRQFRYYCTYCEVPSQDKSYSSFELCINCFTNFFPWHHQHPRSSFAEQCVLDETSITSVKTTRELAVRYELDLVDYTFNPAVDLLDAAKTLEEFSSACGRDSNATTTDSNNAMLKKIDGLSLAEADTGYAFLNQWSKRRRCALCNDDEVGGELGDFIGPYPFLMQDPQSLSKKAMRTLLSSTAAMQQNNSRSQAATMLMSFNADPAALEEKVLKAVTARQRFWVHDACARYSPEVHVATGRTWYNVTAAVRRGKKLRCIACQERGATIGCFEPKCRRSFHLACTGKPIENFRRGIVFWCPQHEVKNHKVDAYIDIFSCNRCAAQLEDKWFSCIECEDFFQTYDLCHQCFSSETDPWNHEHASNVFTEKHKDMIVNQTILINNAPKPIKKQRKHWKGMRGVRFARVTRCSYCWTDASPTWRKIFNGVRVCERCFASSKSTTETSNALEPADEPSASLSSLETTSTEIDKTTPSSSLPSLVCSDAETENATTTSSSSSSSSTTTASISASISVSIASIADKITDGYQPNNESYVGDVDDYMHNPYLTRRCYTDGRFEETQSNAKYLESYGPEEHQMYSLPYDTTYFDIPGRAPRWATHSGTDYHGTWLPQTVRRALLRYTRKNDRILSNFLGRGTDAIESFLLQRRCVGVDINPTAVSLSQRNCSFAVPPEFGITGDLRPTILKADARYLDGPNFIEGSYDHVLSHPPYKDCVEYSAGLQGDLSRFANSQEFYYEMAKVARTSWRLLKLGGRCTVGIGDNREFCFYIPVGFDLLRTYLDNGYKLEELIVKRQRYCSAFGLGTFLCVQYDFLCFTHEFIITVKKVTDADTINNHYTLDEDRDDSSMSKLEPKQILRSVPALPISRQSVIMGTVWTFRADTSYSFSQLCMSRMVERFGKDDTNWKEINLYPEHGIKEPINRDVVHNNISNNESNNELVPATYEEQRKKQIVENNQMLMSLGLITDLGDDANDVPHLEKLLYGSPPIVTDNVPLSIVILPHIEDTNPEQPHFTSFEQLATYRRGVVETAQQAYNDLCISGFFIVGVKDVRIPHTCTDVDASERTEQLLYPLGMLLLEDMNRVFRTDQLKLKELVVTVPNGYSRDPYKWDKNYQEIHINDLPEDSTQRYLPIVHAYYLVFMKLG